MGQLEGRSNIVTTPLTHPVVSLKKEIEYLLPYHCARETFVLIVLTRGRPHLHSPSHVQGQIALGYLIPTNRSVDVRGIREACSINITVQHSALKDTLWLHACVALNLCYR
jgi:hypothetical protein